MIIKRIKKFAIIALSSLAVLPAAGQDLLANQAPIDRKMKAVDAQMLQQLIEIEEYDSPAADLYEDWDNSYAHKMTTLPDSMRIDLRDFCMPTPSRVITSNFGARWGRQHKGLDIKVYIGDTIRAAFSGKVRVVRNEGARKGYGKYIVIRHPNGLETVYGHLSGWLVTENQEVQAGDPIGLGGNTGRSTGSHLHFETRLCGVALNPAIMFDFRNQDVVADNYLFRRNQYERDGAIATQLRGANGLYGYNPADVNSPNMGKSVAHSTGNVRYHKVKKGETLSAIARKHKTTVNALCKLNRIGKNIRLRPGQILKYS
jgi:murein DD-endopeptidase MepM/ murein hydrolase activator NlpD